MLARKAAALGAITFAALLAPFTIDPASDSLFRLQEACGQAGDCAPQTKYICSQKDGDKMDHECTAGCGE